MEKRPVTALGRLTVEEFRAVEKVPLVLVLDNLRSALNVGSVFRTADAFAIERLVLCGITACPPHREINKTALGSTDSVAWTYNPDTIQALQELEAAGYQLWAVEQVHPSLPLQELTVERDMRYAFVLGNEVSGVSDALFDNVQEPWRFLNLAQNTR